MENKFQKIKEKLRQFPFIENIDEFRIDELCEKTDILYFKTGDIILRKGEPCHKGLYLIVEGKVEVENPDTELSYFVEKNDIVGVTAFIGRRTYAVTATCIENAEVIFLPDI
jgi:signal-transduction protein with cAMP-binding, CBS, and nucleotidyltransferase domain